MNADGEPAETEHYHGHRERLRTRFREGGSEALADYDEAAIRSRHGCAASC